MTPREALEQVISPDHAEAILAHRKAKRCPLTLRAAQLLAREFSKCDDPNAAADEVLIRGWQGFKAEWMNKPQQSRPMTNLDRLEMELAERIQNGTGSQGSLDFASVPRLSGRG